MFFSIFESLCLSLFQVKRTICIFFSRKKEEEKIKPHGDKRSTQHKHIEYIFLCVFSQLNAARREPSREWRKTTKCYHSTEAIVACLALFSNNESNFLFQKMNIEIEVGERVKNDITMHQLTYTSYATNTHTHA